MTVTPEHRILVSPRLKSDYENGKSYYPFDGEQLVVRPDSGADQPDGDCLDWRNTHVFLSSGGFRLAMNSDLDSRVRLAAFSFLEAETRRAGTDVLPRALLTQGFQFDGRRVPILGPQFHQQHIRTPHRPFLKPKPEYLEERFALFRRSNQGEVALPL